jgi:pentatricopeptide repeat protein
VIHTVSLLGPLLANGRQLSADEMNAVRGSLLQPHNSNGMEELTGVIDAYCAEAGIRPNEYTRFLDIVFALRQGNYDAAVNLTFRSTNRPFSPFAYFVILSHANRTNNARVVRRVFDVIPPRLLVPQSYERVMRAYLVNARHPEHAQLPSREAAAAAMGVFRLMLARDVTPTVEIVNHALEAAIVSASVEVHLPIGHNEAGRTSKREPATAKLEQRGTLWTSITQLMQRMQSDWNIKANANTYKLLIRARLHLGELDGLFNLLDELERRIVTSNSVLDVCSNRLKAKGSNQHDDSSVPDNPLTNQIASLNARAHIGIHLYTQLINAFANARRFDDAASVVSRMVEARPVVFPAVATVGAVIKCCMLAGLTDQAVKILAASIPQWSLCVEDTKPSRLLWFSQVHPSSRLFDILSNGFLRLHQYENSLLCFYWLTASQESLPHLQTTDTSVQIAMQANLLMGRMEDAATLIWCEIGHLILMVSLKLPCRRKYQAVISRDRILLMVKFCQSIIHFYMGTLKWKSKFVKQSTVLRVNRLGSEPHLQSIDDLQKTVNALLDQYPVRMFSHNVPALLQCLSRVDAVGTDPQWETAKFSTILKSQLRDRVAIMETDSPARDDCAKALRILEGLRTPSIAMA